MINNEILTQEDLMQLEIFAKLATQLNIDNYKGISEVSLYYDAFIDFLNKPENSNLKIKYDSISNKHGFEQIFTRSLYLSLLEKDFREKGIKDEKQIEIYNQTADDFKKAKMIFSQINTEENICKN